MCSERSTAWAFLFKLRLSRYQFFFSSVERIKSMDSSSTKDMDSLVISGGMLAAEGSSGLAGDAVLDVLLSDSTRLC